MASTVFLLRQDADQNCNPFTAKQNPDLTTSAFNKNISFTKASYGNWT